ncbi:MAG: aldo/keto reductase [Hydrogeniiclostridium sp.]
MLKKQYKFTDTCPSVLGLGMMRLPKAREGSEDIDRAKAQEIVDYAYSHGINYFDTAYRYHAGDSELFVGEALKKYPRESFYLASKMPIWEANTPADVEKIFNDQLKRCQVEYFDFYLCHSQNKENFKKIREFGAYEFLSKMKEEGKIRHLGFSFHDTPDVLKEIVETYSWNFAQIQLNYLDWEMQDAKAQYEILTEHGIPVMVMEPVRGGALASLCEESDRMLKEARPEKSVASWAIRYAASLPNVQVVLSGMSNMEQLQDNISTMTDFEPLSEREREVLEQALDVYRRNHLIPCTGCRYCMDCPFGVDIPGVFKLYNQYKISKYKEGFLRGYRELGKSGPESCRACGACMRHCPQKIQIPERMKEIAAVARELED